MRATDTSGNVDQTPATRAWTRFPAPPLPLPEKPEEVAPAPEASKATSVSGAT